MGDVHDAKLETQKALFESIKAALPEAEKLTTGQRVALVLQLSLAYRYAAGGAQPGGGLDNAK